MFKTFVNDIPPETPLTVIEDDPAVSLLTIGIVVAVIIVTVILIRKFMVKKK